MKRPALKAALSLAVGGKAPAVETEREPQAEQCKLAVARVG
jgi:hypothetical protein